MQWRNDGTNGVCLRAGAGWITERESDTDLFAGPITNDLSGHGERFLIAATE